MIELLTRTKQPDQEGIDDGLAMIDESLDGARRGDIVKGLRELSRLEIGSLKLTRIDNVSFISAA